MASIKRFFIKRPRVSLVSKIAGVFFFLLAIGSQVLFGYYFIKDNVQGFATKDEAIAEAIEKTGLPAEIVALYADSILVEGSTLIFAPVGMQAKVPFEPIEMALTWGGRYPVLELEIDGKEFTFRSEEVAVEVVGAEGESKELIAPPIEVEVSVPPIDWGNSLPATLKDDDPYIMILVTEASSAILRTSLHAYASFDLVYAKKNTDTSSTFTNTTREARINNKDFEVVVVSEADGVLLEEAQAGIMRANVSFGDTLGLLIFIEIVVVMLFLFALGVYRGGLE
jgi:hypothetical protein